MKELTSYSKKVRTSISSPVFNDGMVVTAGDLNSAMQYPVALFQTLLRSYFGCGVVCGLKVERYPAKGNGDPGDEKWWLTLHPGTALDQNGHPLTICECQKISLKPDPCSCEELPETVCIAIRRCVVPEQPRDDSDPCEKPDGSAAAHRRMREYVEIKVFDPTDCDLPHLCKKDPNDNDESVCDCLKDCGSHCACGESWVVLACVKLDPCDGITDLEDRRRWVKPIHCECKGKRAEPGQPDPQFVVAAKKKKKAARKKKPAGKKPARER